MTTNQPGGPPPLTNFFARMQIIRDINRDPMGFFGGMFADYGDLYLIQDGANFRQYMVAHPDLTHEITTTKASSFHKDEGYKDRDRGLARFLGNGLLVSDGAFWRRQRKLVAPALHVNRINNYAETMVQYTVDMLDSWRDGARLDINREMSSVTMQIVAKTLFDADVSADVARVNQAMEAIQVVSSKQSILPTWVPTPTELRARRGKRDLDAIIYRIIEERRRTGDDQGDLLSMLLLTRDEDGAGMTDEQARDELVTLFLAGHETTANALTWTWYLLAQHPDIEARLHEEIDTVLAGQPPTLADLDRLPYTDMVIKESMRLYPPAWSFGREAIEDVQIGEWLIPKGSIVQVMSYFMHRDPRWWDNPEEFLPERFSEANEKQHTRHAYIPFGGGPRICIGNAFALMEARLLLATIAQRYRLSLAPGQTVEMLPRITLNPKDGLPMTLHQREIVRAGVQS